MSLVSVVLAEILFWRFQFREFQPGQKPEEDITEQIINSDAPRETNAIISADLTKKIHPVKIVESFYCNSIVKSASCM